MQSLENVTPFKESADGTDGPWVLLRAKCHHLLRLRIGDEGSNKNSLNTSLLDSTDVAGEDSNCKL